MADSDRRDVPKSDTLFTGPVSSGLLVDSLFTVQFRYSTDGGNSFTDVSDLTAVSEGPGAPSAVPAPATLFLLIPVLLGGMALHRRSVAA